MKNANELRTELASTFADVRSGKLDTKTASELANLAGKMIASAKAQLEYYALREEAPTLDFLASTDATVEVKGKSK